MKSIFFVTWLLIVHLCVINSVYIYCDFTYTDYTYSGEEYTCRVKYDLNIFSPNSPIMTDASGQHKGWITKTNKDVTAFDAHSKAIHFFPPELEFVFNNLLVIAIKYCGLKEIHQSDLKPFKYLECIVLYGNKLKVIEEGLFDFNPKIGVIMLQDNEITHIHSKVFDDLYYLEHLDFGSNTISIYPTYAEKSKTDVKKLIKVIKLKYPSTENVYSQLRNHNNELKNLNLVSSKFSFLKNEIETCQNYFDEKIEKLERFSKIQEKKIDQFKSEVFTAFQRLLETVENGLRNLTNQQPVGNVVENKDVETYNKYNGDIFDIFDESIEVDDEAIF